jgi:hypothetical protein
MFLVNHSKVGERKREKKINNSPSFLYNDTYTLSFDI